MNLNQCISLYSTPEWPGIVPFWGKSKEEGREVFSNWYPSQFYYSGIMFPTSEHFMMYYKALLFNDTESAAKILLAKTPKEAKALGRNIVNFNQDDWDEEKISIVTLGCLLKFSENKTLTDFLISTGNKILVEASPYDTIWGVGLSESDPDILNPFKWKGQNLLGFCLMSVRNLLSINNILIDIGFDISDIIYESESLEVCNNKLRLLKNKISRYSF